MATKKEGDEGMDFEPGDKMRDLTGPRGPELPGNMKAKARAAVRKDKQLKEEAKVTVLQEDRDNFGYALRCSACNEDGMYFMRNPMVYGLQPDNWFTAYKEVGQAWPTNVFPCQHCNAPLRVDVYDQKTMFPRERFVVKYPIADYERKLQGLAAPRGKTISQLRKEERMATISASGKKINAEHKKIKE